MRENIVIIGAGGHGRAVADAALLCGYKRVIFLDDSDSCSEKVAGKTGDYSKYIDDCDFFVAIGNNAVRETIMNELMSGGANIATIIHPSSVIGSRVTVGAGTVIMAGSVVNCDTKIGKGVIINTSASIDHDCHIGDFCHISVGSHLAGTVKIDGGTFVGIGAAVINNISICGGCMIGAGAVVVRDIEDCGTYLGVPARKK